ncbi:MAG TPA: extracellular solute-binding protein [Candidatus Udaeobacter sp.]|nr:extracellular solute-binding protein [Candidatus Udaeobacter sp.]
MPTRWLMVLFILLIAGCGRQSVISDPNDVQKIHGNHKVEIVFWNSYNDEETRLLEEEVIPAFEKNYPNIRIKPLHLASNNEFKHALIAHAPSGRGPDVVRLDKIWVPEFSQNGLLGPLNGMPDFEEIRGRFSPEAMDTSLYRNNYYSLPLNIYTKAAIFNRGLLKRAGLSVPPHTMEEVLEIAREHRFIIGLGGFNSWGTLPYIYSLGGTLTNRDFTKATGYLNGEETIRAMERLLVLYKENIIDFSVVTGGGDNWDNVQNGDILMMDEGPWFYSILNEQELNRALKLTIPIPFPHGNGPASIIGGEDLVIPKGSKHPNEAWAFMKWMSGKEAQLIMSRTGLIPTNVDAAKALKVSEDSFIYPYVEALDSSFVRPPVKNWSKIDEVYTHYSEKIFRGEISVKDGLNRAAAEIDKLL